MRGQLQQRLEDLKAEFESGQQVLADLDARRATVRETLLRISGAIQVLEEMLGDKTENVRSFEDYEAQPRAIG